MYKALLIILLIVLLFSCSSNERVVFKITNNSTSTIDGKYIDEIGDTVAFNLNQGHTHLVSDVTLIKDIGTNWYKDYLIEIISITNFSGDTVNFNPNYASNWDLLEGTSGNFYTLYLTDSSF